MSIFDKKGMLIFPNPKKHRPICDEEKLLVFTECYCPNGHNLITKNARFNEFDGILLKISKGEKTGQIALSPVYGCELRVAIGIELTEGTQYNLSCPECDAALPIFSKCHCGGDIFALFLDKEVKFDSFIGACNRVGCANSYIQIGKELITSARLEAI
ncbi:hypothetical protein OU798_12145 [Prolixibacteraceae bacterium Z1-6]|uniref:Uncharacterized protein n=1 Tax=Draconibacterium aestuarii TaxID=2998507 RepID=A0A9X3F5S7_9BACT|nr:hypothetical protein [Prolixibacteraceae bacterium Z1-6]